MLPGAVGTRNKEGEPLSLIPAASPTLDVRVRLPNTPGCGAGILTCFSVAPGRLCRASSIAAFGTAFVPFDLRFPVALRVPTNPRATAVVEEPSSTTAFRVLHMNTCYYYQDLLPGPVHIPVTGRFNPASGIRPTRLRPGNSVYTD